MWKTKIVDVKNRLKAAAIHLAVSALIGGVAAVLVFSFLYPYPYRELSGGRELFQLLVIVDVIMGPLITLAVFNRTKPRAELIRDLAVVGLLQLAALGYGLWTVMAARPVHVVFEFDRFRVVHAIEIPQELLPHAPEGIQLFSLTGPTLLAVRKFRSVAEEGEATMAALQGLSLSARPDLWEAYDKARSRVLQQAKPLSDLKDRFAAQATMIEQAAAQTGRPESGLRYLPLVGRRDAWTVLLDASTAEPCGFVPLDSF